MLACDKGFDLPRHLQLTLQLAVALDLALQLLQKALQLLQIRQRQLGIDDGDIIGRVRLFVYMDDIVVLKTAHDVGNGVHMTDMPQKAIAQAFALVRPFTSPASTKSTAAECLLIAIP